MFNLLVILGVFGSQFFMISNPTRGDELWVYNWLLLITLSSFFSKPNRIVDVVWFGVLSLVSVISVFANDTSIQRPIFWGVSIYILMFCLSVKTIAERITISEKKFGEVILRLWIIIYFVLSLQSIGIVFKDYQLSGFYTMPWIMGCASVLSIPFIRRMKKWYGIILIIPTFLSHSSSIVLVALFMWFRPKITSKRMLLVVLGALIYVFLFDKGLDYARFRVIEKSIPYVHNWVLGDGIGSWAHRAFVRYNGNDLYYWRWAHNELYQITTETGILGALSVLALISNLFKRVNLEHRYYLAGIVAISMFHPIFHIPRLIPFILLILSYMVRRNSVES